VAGRAVMEGPGGREAEADGREILRRRRGVREIPRRLRGRCHRRPVAAVDRRGSVEQREGESWMEGPIDLGDEDEVSVGILFLLSSPAARSLGSLGLERGKGKKSLAPCRPP
jgi:hypothetical protein